MLFSFHRVKLAPRVGWLSLLLLGGGIAAAWIAWPTTGHVSDGRKPFAVQLTGGTLTRSSDSCVLIESVSIESATLAVAEDGAASALFDEDLFLGSVDDGQLFLTFGKQFQWSDGCTWSTSQTITGRLAEGRVRFFYEEHPLDGQTGCWSSCSGNAEVVLR